jgi:hypothetical protein
MPLTAIVISRFMGARFLAFDAACQLRLLKIANAPMPHLILR